MNKQLQLAAMMMAALPLVTAAASTTETSIAVRIAQEMEQDARSNLPFELIRNTTILDVVADGDELVVLARIFEREWSLMDMAEDEADADFDARIAEFLFSVCSDKMFSDWITIGGAMAFVFMGADRHAVTMRVSDCDGIEVSEGPQ